jgi:type IV pilus assembly protein PilC
MKFKYQARTKTGELQVGYVESPNKDAAINILTQHELYVLSIETVLAKRRDLFGFLNRVKLKDVMVFTRQLATLVESELPLGRSIQIMHQQTKNPALKEAAFQLFEDVESGLSLSQALQRQSHIFSDFYISMIRSAEVTGGLEHALSFLASYLEKEVQWRGKIFNAMIYPAILLVLFVVVAGVMIAVVFPKIKPLFEDAGAELPFVSKLVFGAGEFITARWWLVAVVAAILFYTVYEYLKSPEGKRVGGQILLKLPVFGPMYQKIYVSRFAESFSILLKGGIPVAQAIEISGDTIQNFVYRTLFQNMAQGVKEGAQFSQMLLSYSEYFPEMVGQMTAIGETTGRMDDMMVKIADFYEREVNTVVGTLSELLQPVLLVIMGVLVGLLFASILLPIYNLAQTFAV